MVVAKENTYIVRTDDQFGFLTKGQFTHSFLLKQALKYSEKNNLCVSISPSSHPLITRPTPICVSNGLLLKTQSQKLKRKKKWFIGNQELTDRH